MHDERGRRRTSTSTSAFGVSRRESHDASAFYERFTPPELSRASDVAARKEIDDVFVGDARHMDKIDDESVALVVTSPPYFAGKEYEAALGEGTIPATYADYLAMLEAVFAECVHKLEPGGRIAVNVANLGRKPYRSLSADVVWILQDRLRLLLRGEVIWIKARGAAGSCAWGSFQRPANPVLRDLTERVVIASKGRFDRARTARQRRDQQLPSEPSLFRDEFMEATTDVWELPSESATRVGHPAPFPVELPERLIHLYTYRSDLVLDPFMGSGTTAVAAVRTGRHFVGYDTDSAYVERARARIDEERSCAAVGSDAAAAGLVPLVGVESSADDGAHKADDIDELDDATFVARASREGWAARDVAQEMVRRSGFVELATNVKVTDGIEMTIFATDADDRRWYFDVAGGFTSIRPGLRRSEVLWKSIAKGAAVKQVDPEAHVVVLTTAEPPPRSPAAGALAAVCGAGKPVDAVLLLGSAESVATLRGRAEGRRSRSTRH